MVDKENTGLPMRLINLREEHNWSKTEVARRLGLSSMQRYANYEYGKNEPDASMLKKIADLYDVSVDFLVGKSTKRRYYDLTKKDEKDIGEQVDRMLEGLSSDAETNYYGEPMTPEDKEKMRVAMQAALEAAQIEAKKRFTPKKYRHDKE